jgi:hypothetical protein
VPIPIPDDNAHMRTAALILFLGVGGCLFRSVRPGDLQAWKGVAVIELQTHPLFSTLPKRVEVLSDGSEMWTFSNCHTQSDPVTCNTISSTTTCSGGGQSEACCHNQFFVRAGVVEGYRPVGNCYTDCSVRPASRQCK